MEKGFTSKRNKYSLLNIVIHLKWHFEDVLIYLTSTFFYDIIFILSSVVCVSIGTPKINNFPFVPNGKLFILGVPNFRYITMFGQFFHYSALLSYSFLKEKK